MTPKTVTDDFYSVLEVGQSATAEIITKSYRRLARKLHPDKNFGPDATEAFQLLGEAYETLKDPVKRQQYDRLYPSISCSHSPPQYQQKPGSAPESASQSNIPSEVAQITALENLKQERHVRWLARKKAAESTIFELKRQVRILENAIKDLDRIVAAEIAADAQKKSWRTWLLSPIYKVPEETEEVRAHKDRERQERMIQRQLKQRRLDPIREDLEKKESLLAEAEKEAKVADLEDDRKIEALQQRKMARERREREERERREREESARKRRQEQEKQQQWAREEAERLRKQHTERREAQLKRQEEIRAALQREREEQHKRHKPDILAEQQLNWVEKDDYDDSVGAVTSGPAAKTTGL